MAWSQRLSEELVLLVVRLLLVGICVFVTSVVSGFLRRPRGVIHVPISHGREFLSCFYRWAIGVVQFTWSLSLLIRFVDFDLSSNWLWYLRWSHLTKLVFMSGVQVGIKLLATATVFSLVHVIIDLALDWLLVVHLVDGLQTWIWKVAFRFVHLFTLFDFCWSWGKPSRWLVLLPRNQVLRRRTIIKRMNRWHSLI